jgi:hypothetical protein
MLRTIQATLAVVALCTAAPIVQADVMYGDPATWNILNENYGSGAGEVSFNSSFTGGYWGSTAPTETLSSGMASLTIDNRTSYMVRPTISALPTDNSDITIEFKVGTSTNSRMMAGFADRATSPTYNHFFNINGATVAVDGRSVVYAGDTLSDYNAAVGATMTPEAFDGSAVHTYRLIRHDFGPGTCTTLYLDNNATPIGTLIHGSGPGGGDNVTWEWAFYGDGGPASYDLYYAKVATGAYVPTPEPSACILLVTGLIGLAAYAWRKRK